MRFRPCIDLRGGRVVQIVGGTLSDAGAVTNFTAEKPPAAFAERYRADGLIGGHVIALGPGNEAGAREALGAYPGGMQFGGGVTVENSSEWLDAGASHIIVTSTVFREGRMDDARLAALLEAVGRERLVLDLSCRKRDGRYFVVTNRWQCFSDLEVTPITLARLSESCAEFLVHGVDVEGLRAGMEEELIALLGEYAPCPVTYAGGARNLADLELVKALGKGRVDLTIGSALDCFGGDLPNAEVLAWHRKQISGKQGLT